MFNRNFRRDDRGNSFRNNSNMSHGHNTPSLMSVSPWEGGVVPGSGGGSSILGTPQMMQNTQNLLSPQAQVLAQNLSILSNLGLLQSQVQTRQPQGLPSLINLGSALNRSMGPQLNSGFRQMNRQPNRGMPNNNSNRFQEQSMKYGRQDVRRPEPFNKNRPSQSQNSQQKLQSYRPLNSKVTPQAVRKPSAKDAEDLAKARADVRGRNAAKKDSTKIASDDETEEETKKEEGDEVVKKRDWKKEKGDVIEIDDDEDEKTAADVKMEVDVIEVKPNGDATSTVEKDSKGDEEKSEVGDESKEKDGEKSKTDNAILVFNCHVCTKDLSDEAALHSHVRTAAHKRMMANLEEQYALKVKKIRDQMRANEQLKERDWMRNRRGGGHNMPRGNCKMCDLTFLGNITTHRKTPLHLKLKSFLHPNCGPCGKEFPARMEWDMHKLTVEHFKVVCGIDKKLRNLMGSNSNRNEPNYARLVPKFPEGLDSVPGNIDEEKADQVPAADGEGEAGDMKYEPTAVVGMNMLIHGQHCGVCNKFFARRPDVMEHCKTRTHFDNYVAMKAKLKEAAAEKEKLEAEAKAAAEVEAKEATAAKEEEDSAAALKVAESEVSEIAEEESVAKTVVIEDKVAVVCLKRTSAEATQNEGNWKRSRSTKTEEDEEEDDDEPVLVENIEAPDDEEAMKILDALEKYDPLEPTSPVVSDHNTPDTSLDPTQTSEAETTETESPVAKQANKARRGRKRK